jgi:MFS family permease
MTVALILFMLLQPAFGMLSDKIGRRNNMILFSGLATVGSVPLLAMIGVATNAFAAFALIMVGLVIAAFYTSISGVVKAELFPAEVRALGVGLSYAIANAMFGGPAEYVALWLKSIGHESHFFWYVAGMAALVFAASVWMPDTRTKGYLDGSGQIEAA